MLIINSIPLGFQSCRSLNNKLYGHPVSNDLSFWDPNHRALGPWKGFAMTSPL